MIISMIPFLKSMVYSFAQNVAAVLDSQLKERDQLDWQPPPPNPFVMGIKAHTHTTHLPGISANLTRFLSATLLLLLRMLSSIYIYART